MSSSPRNCPSFLPQTLGFYSCQRPSRGRINTVLLGLPVSHGPWADPSGARTVISSPLLLEPTQVTCSHCRHAPFNTRMPRASRWTRPVADTAWLSTHCPVPMKCPVCSHSCLSSRLLGPGLTTSFRYLWVLGTSFLSQGNPFTKNQDNVPCTLSFRDPGKVL